MPSYKDSPQPLRKKDPSPLFKEADDGYVVKAASPIERQRKADGSLHSMNRRSSVEPKDALFIGEDKINKSKKSVSAQMEKDDIDPDDVIKAFMAKGAPTAPRMPPVGKSGNDDDEDEEKSMTSDKGTPKAPKPTKNTDRNQTGGPNNTPRFGLNNLAPKK